MSVRDVAHRRIDELDDEQLVRLLSLLDETISASGAEQPTVERGSLRSLIGIGHSAEPTDVARHKDEYLADSYAVPKQ